MSHQYTIEQAEVELEAAHYEVDRWEGIDCPELEDALEHLGFLQELFRTHGLIEE